MRKLVFGVCNQGRLKPAFSATETSNLEISAIASRGIILSRQRTTKAQIGERGGSVVECRTGARGRGFETYRRRVVSLSKTLYTPKVLVNYPGSNGSVPT